MPWTRHDWLILLLLTLLAATVRFTKLGEVPPGFQFDEAFNAIDAEQVWYGNRPLFLPANGGREALYTYLQVAIGSLLGFTVYSLRLTSALAGIFTIPATYWLLRTMLKRRSRAVALFTSLALAISFWHLHFSHYGIRVILMPLLLCGLIGSFWLSLHSPRPRTRRRALVLAGILTGLAPWTHPAGRFVPFILLGYGGWLIWRGGRPVLRAALTTLLVVGAIAFLVFLPLGIEFYRHPDFFFGHASEVSIFAERVSGESQPWQLLGENMLRVLSMFNVRGDIEWAHNIPGRPVFEWPLGLAFVLGVGIWLVRLLRRRPDDPDVDALALLAGWTAVMLLPSVLSEAAPNYSRTLPAVPAVFVAVGLGLSWLVEMITDWVARRRNGADLYWVGYAVAGSLVAGSGLWASYDYFVRYPQMPESYYIYDADKLDALAALEALAAAGNTVYLAPLWSEHATFAFLRNTAIIKSLDAGETLVLPPPGQGAVYAFPAEKQERAADIAREWDGIDVEMLDDRYGKALLALVKVPAAQLTTWPERYEPTPPAADVATDLPAHFDDAPTLLGLQQRNDNRELRLFWQAEAPTYRNLTTFLHFLDRDGRRVAQVDKLPGDGTYLTPSWTPGERVIEQYHVDLQELCANGDDLTLIVGWYEFAADGARRPRLDDAGNPAGDSAVAGTVTLPITAHTAADFTLPPASNVTVADDLTLYGYTVNGDLFTPGAAFSIDLFWHVSAALNEELVTVQLRQGETALPLWEAVVAPDVPWHTGELVCRRAHVVLPATLPAGNYVLELQAADDAPVAFHTLTLTAQ
ncbi:MAG: phospholipid carrier-dependent glycosyltransferase [Caldilineaceae bacterium]